MSNAVKRPYRAVRRAETAAETRARIRDAATALFVRQGYVATTMRAVASQAGIGERTLYDVFPTKAALLAHTLGVAVVGDEAPVAAPDRPALRAARDEPDPVRAIERLVAFSTALLDRAGDLIMVNRDAARVDDEMRRMDDAGAAATYRVCREFADALHGRGSLRPELDVRSAADILFGLLSPGLHQTFRRRRRWSRARYESWLCDTARQQLLGPA